MDNNEFNYNNQYDEKEIILDHSDNDSSNVVNNHENKRKSILVILLVICIIGIIGLVIVFVSMISPSNNAEEEPIYSKEQEELLKDEMIDVINSYVNATKTAINNMEFGRLTTSGVLYYIPISNIQDDSCIHLEKGGADPFGEWDEAYVVVTYDESIYSFKYYFTFYDKTGYSMKLTLVDDIEKSDIVNSKEINKSSITSQLTETTSSIVVLATPNQDLENNCTVNFLN